MPPHRVAILFEYSTLNGGERSMLAAIDWLRTHDSRFEFAAIVPPTGSLIDQLRQRAIPVEEISFHDMRGNRLSAPQIDDSLAEVVRRLSPELLHANSLAMGRVTGRIASRLTIPTTSHLRDIYKLSANAIGDVNRNQALVAVSLATSQFHAGQGIDSAKLRVIRNGIDLEKFQPRRASGRLHNELGLPFVPASNTVTSEFVPADANRSARLIATIGQIGLRKGQDLLASAAPLIVSKFPNVHFLLIGERNSQKLESVEFENLVKRQFFDAGLSAHLHLLGRREDIADILSECDLIIHPANQEPFGRVLLEATAVGIPVIATNVGGTSEIVADGLTGILVPPRDHETLAQRAVELLSDGPRANRMRGAARERAINEFPIARAAMNLGNLWDQVLKHWK